ncbi:hypothetical protein G6F57_023575 [Rhizopus arrhizus]|nr:hypothetical protein G6F22_020711 [Rhizopus arrhizus]KAG1376339.1 hypothetical protein G6F60_015388 [Rhizopus arrhizus]KAG1421644.1 hypothetical protein G6F57_023575 [Rhizopus arrhizus]
MAIDSTISTPANTSTCHGLTLPTTSGRHEVRAICASMCASSSWLIAAAAEAASQIPRKPSTPARTCSQLGTPGMARTMPTRAVKTIRATTLGLVRSQYWR